MAKTPEELKELDAVLEITPTIRSRMFELVVVAIVASVGAYLIHMIPSKGVYLDKMLGINIQLLHIKIEAVYLTRVVQFFTLASLLYGFWVYLQQKTTSYRLTDLYIEKKYGVLNRTHDQTDLVTIQDQQLYRSFFDRLIGISKIRILAKDASHPEMYLRGIDKEEAQQVINFLKKYAFRNYTDYRIAKDRMMDRKRNKDGKRPASGYIEDIDE